MNDVDFYIILASKEDNEAMRRVIFSFIANKTYEANGINAKQTVFTPTLNNKYEFEGTLSKS